MTIRAFKETLFIKGGGEFIRTVPMRGKEAPYVGYIKTSLGEARVPYDNEIVFETLVSGEEITEKEYNEAVLISINSI